MSILSKLRSSTLPTLAAVLAIMLYHNAFATADGFHRDGFGEKTSQEKVSTFTKRVNAAGGNLNTVTITMEDGDGPMMLKKAYIFADNGLDAGNIHLHNVIVDGVSIAHFVGGELRFVTASEDAPKSRGGELTHILHDVMNIDELQIMANESIKFDFMAAGTNDPNPTPTSVMVHVTSSHDATINVELEE